MRTIEVGTLNIHPISPILPILPISPISPILPNNKASTPSMRVRIIGYNTRQELKMDPPLAPS
ncbi:hypothetical protein Oscil6304_5638 [Oscillatoria acuminata PCC 6304]|uniref:Uncharacterized protein n=1 Tax=Oscillatoria acuminata PCC 6304 TaxID=56110 RepID=K9TSX0_9CYAN|nr:hypothetical protein Oscil6304_5638 [Oscillatoria acuminata PCC 6304]